MSGGHSSEIKTDMKVEPTSVAANDDHFKSRETTTMNQLHSSSLLNNKDNSMVADLCNTPSFDPGSKVYDFIDSTNMGLFKNNGSAASSQLKTD